MTITMTVKNQVTIPQEIVSAMGLKKGTLFNVEINRNRIELVPLEPTEKVFTDKEYEALNKLCQKEKGQEKKVTKKFIENLKKGKV
jgi:AbrB family looped-hinge helix DNA binding protein